ncbi:HEPN domain-containing protein [Streptococcus tangpeifui]|uniref:HEPN domain-containing protein n=1 Tax=Streptococcus tangpeifui TaxID=2709400 RepID=UPI001F14E5BB|nr:HEPN domain-containing protein [Streptococcus sp. ZJ373]
MKELRNESIIMLHVSENDFFKLGDRAIASSIKEGTLAEDFDKGNLDSIFTDPKVTSSKMYSAFINYYILRLTAVLELYFKDSIKQLLKLNIDLLVKGFKETEKGKSEKNLDKNYVPKKYLKYLNRITEQYSSGKKFSGKYQNYSKFLEIDENNTDILDKLDNLFSLRNDLAHLNRFPAEDLAAGTNPRLTTVSGFEYSRETSLSKENFEEVVKELLDLTIKVSKFLKQVEQTINSKWKPDYEKAEVHYKKLVQKLSKSKE